MLADKAPSVTFKLLMSCCILASAVFRLSISTTALFSSALVLSILITATSRLPTASAKSARALLISALVLAIWLSIAGILALI